MEYAAGYFKEKVGRFESVFAQKARPRRNTD